MAKFVIEHLEDELYDWCIVEYRSMSKIVGKDNLIVANIKNIKDIKKISAFCEARKESVLDMELRNACLLDMDAENELSPEDSFEYLVFGGILGDFPPKKRTMKSLSGLKAELRHLGKEQMPTDNAVLTAKMILIGRKKLSEIRFIDCPSFRMEEGLELELPFRFVEIDGKPYISDELINHIKRAGF